MTESPDDFFLFSGNWPEIIAWKWLEEETARRFICEQVEPLKVSSSPRLINIAGIPGSGKSTVMQSLRTRPEFASFLSVSFDAIMEQLPGYSKMAQTNRQEAFRYWEARARTLGYGILLHAAARRKNILLEHSASLFAHVTLYRGLRTLKTKPYTVEMIWCDCPVEVARRRIQERNQHSQRITPDDYVTERDRTLRILVAEYYQNEQQDVVDHFQRIETDV